jgi:NAD(P)-dependent dehydrogenase (short-subunit alcohol dehydrogenase family)
MHIDLNGLRALVTGSTRGIGKAIAHRLAESGATVAINGRSAAGTAAAVASLAADYPACAFIEAPGDLANADEANAVFAAAGLVDILVNNAGIFGKKAPFEVPDEEWMEIFQVNVLTAVRGMRHYGPSMARKGWGRIINIGSEAGVSPPTELVHYAASKAALHAASRGFAQALAGTGVTVNTIIVGPTAHEGATAIREQRAAALGIGLAEFEQRFFREERPTSVLRRYVTAEEVASLVAFVVSREAGFASGAPWRADCGTLTMIA